MRAVASPDNSPEATLAACVLALLELGWDDGPGPYEAERWQEWLAERNLQVHRAAELPGSGFWVAEYDTGAHAVMFGSPPGPVHEPAGPGEPVAAYVVAALDPLVRGPGSAQRGRPPVLQGGAVEAIVVAPAIGAPCTLVEEAEAVPGRGLRGDRYFDGVGTFSRPGRIGQDLTLIAAEQLDYVGTIGPADARRNVVTRGIDVNALLGERFTIGEVECLGRRWCEPCAVLQRYTRPGVLRDFVHRAGLRADILTPGTIRVGDRVTT